MRRRILGAIVLSISLLASNAFAITGIKDTPVLTTLDGFSSFDQQPAINSNGDIVFSAVDSGGTSGVYFYSAQDGTVFKQDFGPVQANKHELTINANDQIGFVGDTTTGQAIYTKTASSTGGGTVITIQGDNFSQYSDPAVLDNGSILFTAIDTNYSNQRGIYAASSGGQVITIIGASDLPFTPTGDIAANNSGSYAIAGTDNNTGSLGVYDRRVGSGTVATMIGPNFSSVSTLSTALNGSKVAWSGTISLSGSSSSALYIASLGGGSMLTVTGGNFGQASINSSGDVLADVTDTASGERSLMEYLNNGAAQGPVLSIGDSLDGSTITDFSISPNALNDNGEFVFEATLADGQSGLYTSFVPEPTVLAPLVGGILLMWRRRSGTGRGA